MFATLDYEGCCTKNETEKIATRWAGLLRTAGMDISTYVIEENQVLFSSQAGLCAGISLGIREFRVASAPQPDPLTQVFSHLPERRTYLC